MTRDRGEEAGAEDAAATDRKRKKKRRPPQPAAATAAPLDPKATDDGEEARIPRRALTVGGALLPVGLALVGIEASDVGMVVTLGALLVLIYGVHSFGRLGPGRAPLRGG